MKYRCFSALALFAACLLSSDSAEAAWLTEPPVSIHGNCWSELTLSKDLHGFDNYGAVDGSADILYSGEGGSWTFEDPCGHTEDAYLQLWIALDDHYNMPIGNYELRVVVNGRTVASGYADDLGLRHGTPHGQQFVNWSSLWISVKPAYRYDITVYNQSGLPQEHWIAIDKISMHLRE